MREIKFRAWDKDLKGWIVEKFWLSDGVVWIRRGDMLVQLETELVQFTGLQDKNDKQIYEGDILKHRVGQIAEVIFERGGFKPRIVHQPASLLMPPSEEIEVIGNIYSNPELLTSNK